MQLEELLQKIGNYSGITDDSRKVKKNYIFVAVAGISNDGHDFIPEAVRNGAGVVVCEKETKLSIPYLKVLDSREALGKLASHFFGNPSNRLKVIGVTGTDGKTTTANLIYFMLETAGKRVGLISTLGAKIDKEEVDTGLHVTNPDPISLQKILSEFVLKGAEFAVVEVTSHGLDQKRVAGVKFDMGVLTNVTREHLDYHKTFEAYVKAKSKLFAGVRISVLNKNDSSYKKIKPLIPKGIKISEYPIALNEPLAEAINARFPEDYNKLNTQAAIVAVREYGLDEKDLVRAINSFPELPGRMEEIKGGRGFRVFVDFAHTPNALKNALFELRKKVGRKGKIISVFGSAGERDRAKRPIMGEISARLADVSVFTAEDPRSEDVEGIIDQLVEGTKKVKGEPKYYRISERGEAIWFAVNKLAGSEDIVAIFGKGHEKSMAYGVKEYPWSDQEAVYEALKGRIKLVEKGFDFDRLKNVHFTGIKGVGMASLALCFDDLGIKVSGSDTNEVFVTDETLEKRKIEWRVGFSGKNVSRKCDLLITTGAHGGLTNPEVLEAKKRGIATITHAEGLAKIAAGKEVIAVSGVGGKSTTSSIISHLLEKAGLEPSFAIGVGNIFPLGTPGKFNSKGKHFICEADEFAISPGINDNPRFSLLSPKILVATNIEHDHPDIYPRLSDTKETFKEFFKKVPEDGWLVVNVDNKNIRDVISDVDVPKATYGFSPDADWKIFDVSYSPGSTLFSLIHKGDIVKNIKINIPGQYNVQNATAAFVVATLLGISPKKVKDGLNSFVGVKRRFEFVGEVGGMLIYDDYAHHPLEIKAVLKAVREWFPDRRVVAVFQPHTYSRTKALFSQFAMSFKGADVSAFMDIYSSAREKKDPNVSSERLAQETKKYVKNSYYIGSHKEATYWLKKNLRSGDLLLTLGAGDIFYLHEDLLGKTKAINEPKSIFGDKVLSQEPLENHTTLGLGGPASFFIKADSEDELTSIVKKANSLGVKSMVIGDGSDLLVSEKGFPGLVIKNNIQGMKTSNYKFMVKCGTSLQSLVDRSIMEGCQGMEKMTGIPGTVGGAVYGNAGAYGQVVSDNLTRVRAFDGKKVRWVPKKLCQFGYRESIFKKNKWVLLEVEFLFKSKVSPAQLKKEAADTLTLRLKKYKPGLKCPGSFFKNIEVKDLTREQLIKIPKEKIVYGKIPAGYLLEEVGAKGKRLGKILIADFHANLFINTGGGNPTDFYKLAKTYTKKVEEKFGIKLEPEVQLVGFSQNV